MSTVTNETDLVRAKFDKAMEARALMMTGSKYSGWFPCACGVEGETLRVVAQEQALEGTYKFGYSCTNCSFRLQE